MKAVSQFIPPARPDRVRRLLLLLAVSAFVCGRAQNADAASGGDLTLTGHDLRIAVDANWAGCAQGGYYPIRVRATNVGPARDLTFSFDPSSTGMPRVSRSLRLEQNATLKFTLAVPMVGDDSYGTFHVAHDGGRLENMSGSLSLPDRDYGNFDRPALLIVSDDAFDTDEFELGVNFIATGTGSSGYGRGSTRTDDNAVVEPGMLPDRWIDYSGLDIVAISLPVLERLSPSARAAILGWTRTGGNLLVYDAPDDPATKQKLVELTELPSADDGWKSPDASGRNFVPVIEASSYGEYGYEEMATEGIPPARPEGNANEFVWPGGSQAFKTRDFMQGQLIVFPSNPFPGSRHEWAWLLATIGPERFSWTQRYGMSARQPNHEFLEFLIPGISGVPVFAFLMLITIFSVVIGPVNYYFLAKRRRLHLLVISIPLIAAITSASLFGYSLIAHGFGTKSRVRSLTIVDQRLQKSVTSSRISLYSGLAPSDGLEFSPETAVFPIWPYADGETFDVGSVDWTLAQSLRSGWLKSRTRTQFLTTTYRDQRERLQVTSQSGKMQISNGFGFELSRLLVADSAGNLYFGERIAAGANATLTPATPEQSQTIRRWLGEHRPQLPEEAAGSNRYQNYGYDPYGYNYAEVPSLTTSFGKGQLERSIPAIESGGKMGLEPSSYFAVLEENPGVSVGLDGASEVAGTHLLLGRY